MAEQQMEFEEVQRDEFFEEAGRDGPEFSAGYEGVHHYHEYAGGAAGEKIKDVAPATSTSRHGLILAVFSLCLLTVVSLAAMQFFVSSGMAFGTPAPSSFAVYHHHMMGWHHFGDQGAIMTAGPERWQTITYVGPTSTPSHFAQLLFFLPLFMLFVAVMWINMLFHRKR